LLFLCLLFALGQLVVGWSYPTPSQPDPTYQTGIVTLLSSALSGSGTYMAGYNFVMSTPSLNASLGIFGIDYSQRQNKFGFRMSIASLTSSSLNVYVRAFDSSDPIKVLKISYLVSYSPYLEINYA
jgi:hypothetical protein